ncbi:flagellar motor protein MotB [Stutzerimonas stutzeri]|uniref:flagellar motor protein MotB n=1 Tax=Stutzerimonas stutzeri TaxID=316 RepID=UPI0015E28544|nr:flagellar motor protein MotB [Stutzerimonas stutzeri]MBA1264814.1 flagellar motor protein MotB [Stutzerimonas stutzeri]
MDNNQPIIVKRVKKTAAGHHGGAWKIAFADFATAMMAFFLVMWLMSSATPEQKRAISGYFQDPIGFTESASPFVIDLGGTPTPAPDRTLNDQPDPAIEQKPSSLDDDQLEGLSEQMERERLNIVLQELQNKIEENPDLTRFKDQILFEITQDGLRIQIVDAANRPMFALGSAQLQPYFEDILLAMADTIRAIPNKISISGHTDAKPYVGNRDFGNWELSASRANAARRTLVAGSYPEEQIARVVGYASSALYDREDPFNPINRRIDMLVLTKKAQRSIEGEQSEQGTPAAQGSSEAASPSEPLQPTQLRERLNIFEEGVLNFEE